MYVCVCVCVCVFFETIKCFIWSLGNCNSEDTVSSKTESVSGKRKNQGLIKVNATRLLKL